MPTIQNLEKICNAAFGTFTLSTVLFRKEDMSVSLTPRQMEMLCGFDRLAPDSKQT